MGYQKIKKYSFFCFLAITFFVGYRSGLATPNKLPPTENNKIIWETLSEHAPNFQTPQAISRIAFGSCCHQEKKLPIFKSINAWQPDLWIWTGDIIYGDTTLMKVLKQKYLKQFNKPRYKKLRQNTAVIGCWDDHDFGVNNGGKHYPKKVKSQKLLLDFLEEPLNSPRRKQKGIYASYTIGPPNKQIKIFLLDCRYHRDDPGKEADILGEAQWVWLEKELNSSRASLNLICSGIQIIPRDHQWEKWAEFPQARNKLFQMIAKAKIPGVIMISGDRHIAEISKIKTKAIGYPVYEVTSSGLTHSYSQFTEEKNRYREGDVFSQLHFGSMEIDWENSSVKLHIRDLKGDVQLEKIVAISKLKKQKSPN